VEGLLVTLVVPGGPSADAGLRAGDLITSIDGRPATDTTQLVAIALSKRPGDTVRIDYERNGQKSTATVTLGQQPTSST
jgi:putative serine protease PepD